LIDATNQLAALRDDNERLNQNTIELLRLRNEAGLLRQQTNNLAKTQSAAIQQPSPNAMPENNPEHELIPREKYEFAGFAEPKAAAKSMLWAFSQGDLQLLLSCVSPAQQSELQKVFSGKTEDEIRNALLNDNDNRRVTGYRITNQLEVSDNEVVLSIFQEGRNREKKMRLVRIGDEWKFAGNPGM
jgi:hypothetical protein